MLMLVVLTIGLFFNECVESGPLSGAAFASLMLANSITSQMALACIQYTLKAFPDPHTAFPASATGRRSRVVSHYWQSCPTFLTKGPLPSEQLPEFEILSCSELFSLFLS